MAQRKKIGIIYIYDEALIGVTYYIQNLIRALHILDDEKKPHITILTTDEASFNNLQGALKYPYLNFQPLYLEASSLQKFLNKITFKLIKKQLFFKRVKNIDAVFPYKYFFNALKKIKTKIFWIPDFQEHFLPSFFSKQEINNRKNEQKAIAKNGRFLILSSKNAEQHFRSIYPESKIKTFVLPFAVTHPLYQHISIDSLLRKYNLPQHYFILPNQFWIHKNHKVVIEACKILHDSGHTDLCIILTGKPEDFRHPGYYEELIKKIKDYKLEASIKILGFIDRAELLQLMNNSLAIIQPSYFEGWSTVVEDAKALNKMIIVSDIPVHREQLIDTNALFFDCDNAEQLSQLIKKIENNTSAVLKDGNVDYKRNIIEFGEKFANVMEHIS